MDKKRLIALIIFVGLGFNLKSVIGSKVAGYIILNNSDTIFGEIKLSIFDYHTGGIVFSGINLEPFHSSVSFREKSKGHFISYTPKDLIGFGFMNKSINYRFKTFSIDYKSIIKSERKRLRFLNLIYQGEIFVYRDIVRKDNIKTFTYNDKAIDYYDYYLFTDKHGLNKVIWTKDYKTLIDLLKYYEIDQKFIEQLPSNVGFKNIKAILNEN